MCTLAKAGSRAWANVCGFFAVKFGFSFSNLAGTLYFSEIKSQCRYVMLSQVIIYLHS